MELGRTAVPTKDLRQECPHLDFAKLPEPRTVAEWGFLSYFGVLTKCDTTARIRELEALSSLPPDEVIMKAVHNLYRNLSKSLSCDNVEIRRAFRDQPLVFIPKPKPQWIELGDCLWSGPGPLKRPPILDSHYRDCKNLFRDRLGLENAGIQHVVSELCFIEDEDCGNPTGRFEELSHLLTKFLSQGSPMTAQQIWDMKRAKVFPVLSAGGSTDSNVELRSLNNQTWYIPDKTTLHNVFRGQVDLLDLSVETVQSLDGLLIGLGCKDRFLSSAVEQVVKPSGECIRDLLVENDIKARFEYISRLTTGGLAESQKAISRLRVWSVPSIQMTRRLDDIEITEDSKLLTIQEIDSDINMYMREISSLPTEHPLIRFELAEFVFTLFTLDIDDSNLTNLILSSDLHTLPALLENHDRFTPKYPSEEVRDTDTSSTTSDESNQSTDESGSEAEDTEEESESTDTESTDTESTDTESADTESESEDETATTSPSFHTRHTHSFRDIIPSHQARADIVVRRASKFRMGDCLVGPAPVYTQSPPPSPSSITLSIRTESVNSGSPYASPGHQGHQGHPSPSATATDLDVTPILVPKTISHIDSRYNHPTPANQRYRTPSPHHQQQPVSDDRPMPVWEIRSREIGFLGEAFVYQLFDRQIEDWTVENWTSKLRIEAGHPRFTRKEKDYADFTYLDSSGYMKRVLRSAGVEPRAAWTNSTTYHLEVKTTLAACNEAFHISQNQVDMMRGWDHDPENAYILLRVFDIEGKGVGIKFFPSPWGSYVEGVLEFRSEGGYTAFERNPAEGSRT